MRFPFRAFLGVLLAAASAYSAEPPTVSLVLTYDASISQPLVRHIERIVRAHAQGRHDWRLVLQNQPLVLRRTSRVSGRRALVERGRRVGADYAADIRFSKVQPLFGAPWIKAQGWVVAPDSAAYVIVTETAWPPGDTTTMVRQIKLLLDRLVPPSYASGCYVEFHQQETVRDSADALLISTGEVHILAGRRRPIPSAVVYGHWRINGRPGTRERLVADTLGVARVRFEADRSAEPVGDVSFVVDSVDCPGVVFDQQWPQREVDRALALLENARADLDEEKDYTRAARRAEQFLALDEDDVAWYSVLMNPPDALDRRQQALHLLRRARMEERRGRVVHVRRSGDAEGWALVGWFGYDPIPPQGGETLDAQPANCDTCPSIALSASDIRRVEFGAGVRRHVFGILWLHIGVSWAYGRETLHRVRSYTRTHSFTTLSSSVWFPRSVSPSVLLYTEFGARLVRRSADDLVRYWTDAGPVEVVPSGTYWREPEAERGFVPGGMFAIGAALRMSDWAPIWAHGDARVAIDRLPRGGTGWRITARMGASLWR